MLSNRDKAYLSLAVKTAQLSDMWNRHGAVLVRGGSVLALGINKSRNDPVIVRHLGGRCRSRHAEVVAIARAGNVRGATIYLARLDRGGNVRLSKPCKSCQKYLDKHGIKRVVYTQ